MKNARRFDLLQSPLFLFSLIVLLLNDWYLKYQLHNWLTGKLSDVAGLVVFYLFFFAFLPKHSKFILWTTVVLFVFWKTPASQGIIDSWNNLIPIAIDRVVDYTDYLAIPVLLYVAHHVGRWKFRTDKYAWRVPIVILSLVAITGTSSMPQRTREEIELDQRVEKIREERVTNYEIHREDIPSNTLVRVERLMSTFPEFTVLRERGVEPGIWEGSKMSAISYDFAGFYINTWVFYNEPDKVTEYYIVPNDKCDLLIALDDEQSASPFLFARFELLRQDKSVQIEMLEMELCDMPAKKSKKQAVDYFLNNVVVHIEKAFY